MTRLVPSSTDDKGGLVVAKTCHKTFLMFSLTKCFQELLNFTEYLLAIVVLNQFQTLLPQ